MTDIFQIASIGMLDGRQRLDAISQNTAGNGLAGYRRHVVVGTAFDATFAAAGRPADAGGATVRVDTRPGALAHTGRALDVAVDGDGLYFGLTDGARTWLTRSGAFRLDADGVLVGEGGLRVLGTQGDVHLPGTDVAVGADGRIARHGETVGALQLFRVAPDASLKADAGALLATTAAPQPASDGRVRGGSLEASNTDAAHEVVDAMAASRQFEAMSRVVQSYDEALGQAIEKLGNV